MQSILYTRVSTNSQGGESLNAQNQICLNHLNAQGITLSASYSEISSAYNGPQKSLHYILNSVNNCCVYVYNVSRFSRNIINGMNLIQLAKSKNINIHFIEENLDTSNSNHAHQIRVKISEAQLESETLSNRVLNRNKLMKGNGWQFGNPKYGKVANVTLGKRKFDKSSEESKVIDFIVQARSGTSCQQLNNKLKKIIPTADPIHFYDKDGVTKINYFNYSQNLTFKEISDLLNDYEINKRGKRWTASGVAHIYNDHMTLESGISNISLSN